MSISPEATSTTALAYEQPAGADERTVRWTPPFPTVFGWPVDRWKEPTLWWGALHPDDREAVEEAFGGHPAAGTTVQLEYRMLGPGSDTHVIHDHATFDREPVDADAPDGGMWRGVMVDVTQWEGIEERLREAQTRYRGLVEQIPAITYVDLV